MAGTMKFSEVPPYPYTCRSLHRVRTGKILDISAARLPVSKERFKLFVGIRESIGLGNISVSEGRKWTGISKPMPSVRGDILEASPVA